MPPGTRRSTTGRDKDGADLLGDKQYRLRVPAKPPVKRFWAVTAYNPISRSLLMSDGPITVSSLGDPEVNEKNSIKPDPAMGFFVVFRFYGPLEGYIDKTWVLDDFELLS